jgi:hypothetical protein
MKVRMSQTAMEAAVKIMSNNIEGKVVIIAGASGGPGEASDRPDQISCLALKGLRPAGDRR